VKKAVLIVIISLILFTLAFSVYADDPLETLHTQKDSVENIIELLKQGNDQQAIRELDSLHSAVVHARANLQGLSFEGKSGKKLTDPFKLPKGTYRVHFITKGFGAVKVMPLEEDSYELLFNLHKGQASEGASAVYRSIGEKIMIQLLNITQPYKLYFEKLG